VKVSIKLGLIEIYCKANRLTFLALAGSSKVNWGRLCWPSLQL